MVFFNEADIQAYFRQLEEAEQNHTFDHVFPKKRHFLLHSTIFHTKTQVISSAYDSCEATAKNQKKKKAFIKMMLTYEWNMDTFKKNQGEYLTLLITIIDRNKDLFPVTEKLENMLRDIYPKIDFTWFDLEYNEKLFDLCIDIGMVNLGFNRFTPTHVRKGIHNYERTSFRRLCLYVQSVMITN
jgi:hypothetical protein